MIWFDIDIPKSVQFFKPMIDELRKRGEEVFITSRGGEGYTELQHLMDFFYKGDYTIVGRFGGATLEGKFRASLDREEELLDVVLEEDIDTLVTLSGTDASRVAYGLGIKIINFYDMPIKGHDLDISKALPQARLSLPLSSMIFKPFMVPDEIYMGLGATKENLKSYNFIDPFLWLKDFEPSKEIFEKFLDRNYIEKGKKIVVIREEEFASSYVQDRLPLLYDGVKKLSEEVDASYVVIPRYDYDNIEDIFYFANVVKEKFQINHLLAHADLFIGGGGTMNIESTYFGVPTISTRSFISHYDKFFIDNDLSTRVESVDELVDNAKRLLETNNRDKAKEVFGNMSVDMDMFIDAISEN